MSSSLYQPSNPSVQNDQIVDNLEVDTSFKLPLVNLNSSPAYPPPSQIGLLVFNVTDQKVYKSNLVMGVYTWVVVG
jgi:hypothetical protein